MYVLNQCLDFLAKHYDDDHQNEANGQAAQSVVPY